LEKLLKAHVCKETHDLAPRIHNLNRLAELAGLSPSPEQVNLMARMTELQREGRYPNPLIPPPGADAAREGLRRAEELFQWLLQRL
jgi:HEPN domain-containing protein